MNRTTNEIRQTFLNFFKEKEHVIVPSSSLIPYNDDTLLFTNAGMNQFKDIFLGKQKTQHTRITTAQRCLRTGGKHNDLDNVGYTSKHHTFFEMLGNFSFGDYFKKEAIEYAWELLTSKKWFNIPKNKLWVSVYKSDNETYEIWNKIIQIPAKHIVRIGDKNHSQYHSENFWQMGDRGPCGPCTEIFYDYGNTSVKNTLDFFENKNNRFVEIWNIVFIEFNRVSKTKIVALPTKSIDTGMGLERISAVLQQVHSNYNIDIFKYLIDKISRFSNTKNLDDISLKIIADHIRSSSYIIAENIVPSNENRGYVLRRIIRRALRHGHKIGIRENFFYQLVSHVIQIMGNTADILKQKQENIQNILKKEEIKFSQTLDNGLKILQCKIKETKNNILSGKTVFYLYDTFGFPVDLTADVCREKNIKIDYTSYNIEKELQKKKSNIQKKFYKNYNEDIVIKDACVFQGYKKNKTKSLIKKIFVNNQSISSLVSKEQATIILDKTTFYGESGGQIGDIGQLYYKNSNFIVENTKKYGHTIAHIGRLIAGKITVNNYIYSQIDQEYRHSIALNHSATHLLHSALRKILGKNVNQKGSLVTSTHLRFDFSYEKNINTSIIKMIEALVNLQIRKNILIKTQELNLEEAKKTNAIALFDNQYSSIVRVVFINNFSIELCCGTHTKRTGDIGLFKILSYTNIASGIKRIEAVTGQQAIDHVHEKDNAIQDIATVLNCNKAVIKEKIHKLIMLKNNLEKKVHTLEQKENTRYIKQILKKIDDKKETKILINTFYNYNHKLLRIIIDQLKIKLKNSIIILINIKNNFFTMIVGVTQNLIHYITAKHIINIIVQKTQGKGGGKSEIAEGGGVYTEKLPIILKELKLWIYTQLK